MTLPAPWALVERAAEAAGVTVVPLPELADVERLVKVCDRIWGAQSLEPGFVRAFQHAGEVLFGAEANGELVGFVLGFLGWEDGLHLHSHMLGVVPGWESRGVGFALKLAQRAASLERGVHEARWTFDPLVPRNGRLNLVRLGAVGIRVLPGFYGAMQDRINRGDRTDRFEVRWRLRSERVERALGGVLGPPEEGPVILAAEGEGSLPRPKPTGTVPQAGSVVEVPRDHHGLRARDPGLGWAWREASAEALESCFRAGLVAVWTEVGPVAARYVFGLPESAE